MQNFNTAGGNKFRNSGPPYILDEVAFALIYSYFNLDLVLTMKVYNDNFMFQCPYSSLLNGIYTITHTNGIIIFISIFSISFVTILKAFNATLTYCHIKLETFQLRFVRTL